MSAEAMFESALLLLQAGHKADALDALAEVLKADATHARAWAVRGQLEHEAGRHFNGLMHYNHAVKYDPNSYQLWSNRGLVASSAGLVGIARDSYEQSIKIKDNREARINMGHLHSAALEVDEAVKQYREALRIDPKDAQALSQLGIALIARGDWAEGWNAYRHRFNNPYFPPRPNIDFPWWRGESVEGRTVLLFSEQGYGDEIMALRFAEPVKKAGARVIISARPPVYRIARSVAHADAVIMQYDKPPWQPDFCCALLDVPAFTGLTPDTLPGKAGYLKSTRDLILELPDGLKVGVCWESGKRPLQPATDATAKAKSLRLEQLGGLARPGVTIVSLQQHHNAHAAMEKMGMLDPMTGVTDFEDTAWIMRHLDLIITVDTSVAHLAGALGKPVWNLVRFDALWPWSTETDHTKWYHSMKVYRQPALYNWHAPLARLMADFTQFVGFSQQQKVA